MTAAIRLKRKAKGERPYFFADPNVDKVISMVMGLAGEVAVMHDRLDTLERLLERTGAFQRSDIETFQVDTEAVAERSAWREAFLGEVLRIIEIEVEALESGDLATYDTAVAVVEDEQARPTPPRAAAPKPARSKAVARVASQGTGKPRTTKKAPAAKKPAARKAAGKKRRTPVSTPHAQR